MGSMIYICVFIGSIYMFNIVNGTAVTIADCGDPVAEGAPQVLTCHITGSIAVGINWFREGDINSIISCTSKICVPNNVLYSVNSTAHPDNKQQFTVKSVLADDFTKKWICIDHANIPDPITAGTSCTLSKRSDGGGLSHGGKIGTGFGVAGGVIGGVVGGIMYRKKKKKKKKEQPVVAAANESILKTQI